MLERYVEFAGTISIATGATSVTGNGTLFGGRDREAAQIWVHPVAAAPYRIGTVAAVDPRGVYSDSTLPLVHAWNGAPVVAQPYELIDGAALSNGTTQAAIYARFAAFLEQNMGLVGNTADAIDYSLVPNNTLFVDAVTRTLYQWRNGVLGRVQVIASAFTPRGAYDGGTTYAINDLIQSGGGIFVSNVDGNVGHTPTALTSDAYWTYFPLPQGGKYFAVAINAIGQGQVRPDAGELIGAHEFIATVSFPAAFLGSRFMARATATADAVATIKKVASGITTTIGTITFAAGVTDAVLAGAAVVFSAGDRIELYAPASRDATLGDIIGTFAGTQDGGSPTERQGQGQIDFGSGDYNATLVITGQTAIQAGSLVQAWLAPADTADHTIDEHRVADLQILAGEVVAGVGFTIYGQSDDALAGLWNVGWRWA